MKKLLLFTILAVLFLKPLSGSDWITISPITDRIIMLQFDDGYIQHYGYHESGSASVSVIFPMDTAAAGDPLNYIISSPDDPDYSSDIHPLDVGRKSKGHDFNRQASWNAQVSAYAGDIAYYHYIYLFLPDPIKEGNTYVIALNDLAGNYNIDTLYFDVAKTRSELIHVNQVGYHPDAAKKYAYLSQWMGDRGPLELDAYEGTKFHLNDLYTGEEVFEGIIQKRLDVETSAEYDLPQEETNKFISMTDVWECDFSGFTTPGEYVLTVENIGCSFPFEIGTDIYREAHYHTTRALYHHRTGIELEEEYTQWTRPRTLHPEDGVTQFQYTTSSWFDFGGNENGDKATVLGNVIENSGIATWGWYMDAGDFDGYYSHTKIPRYLMTAWELAPEKFSDNELNIPGSGNGIPDILDEAKFLIDYLDRTRGPGGGVAGTRIHPDFTSHETGIPSWEDDRVWTIYGEDVQSTFTFAGLAAHLSYCYSALGETSLADDYLDKAEDAYDWAISNMDNVSDHVNNTWLYAAACLYKATGVSIFQTHFKTEYIKNSPGSYAGDNKLFAVWAYITTDHSNIDETQYNSCLGFALNKAQSDIVNTSEIRSFRVGFNLGDWISLGQTTTPKAFPALVAYHVTGEEKYLTASQVTCDFFLGGNPMNMLWMTGYGDRHPMQVLHLDTWYREDGNNDDMIPGIIPYGATNRDWMNNVGPWASTYAMLFVYPDTELWPMHEMYFDNRHSVPSNEYTVHQTIAPAAAVYGLMSGESPGSWIPNKPPSAEITSPASIEDMASGAGLKLEATVSDEDGTVLKVEYYNDWQKIGESDTPPFTAFWNDVPEGPYSVYAVAIDNKGARGESEKVQETQGNRQKTLKRASLAPNPVNEWLSLEFELPHAAGLSLEIFDTSGRLIMKQDPGSHYAGQHSISLNVSELEPGNYISILSGTLSTGKVTFTNQFIKQ